jgi:hypothetical protein
MKHIYNKKNRFLLIIAITIFFLPKGILVAADNRAGLCEAGLHKKGVSRSSCDSNVLNALNRVSIVFALCCNQLKQDFNETFSTLQDIKNNICCTNLAEDFNGTSTALNDIKNSFTTCCAEILGDFQATWSVLAEGFNGTFTEIVDLNASLTECCQETFNNFQLTFSIIANLKNVPCLIACAAVPITVPIVISSPGTYCLAADGIGSIIINADNVTVSLNNHTITGAGVGSGAGVVINPGINRKVKNGKIRNFDTGVSCDTCNNTILNDLEIDSCFAEGISIVNSRTVYCNRLLIRDVPGIGVHFSGLNSVLKNIIVSEAQQGFVFTSCFNSLIQECSVFDCSSSITPGTTLNGFVIVTGDDNQFDNCSVKSLISSRSRGFAFNDASNIILNYCTIQNIVTTSVLGNEVIGFDCTSSSTNIQLYKCVALGLSSSSQCTGYALDGITLTINNCNAQFCTGLGDGFVVTGTNVTVSNCLSFEHGRDGFATFAAGPSIVQFCEAGFNGGNGFIIASDTVARNCIASNNAVGFLAPSTALIYRCFASSNGTNYSITTPNTQDASTQVNKADAGLTGPFAGGNLFMP